MSPRAKDCSAESLDGYFRVLPLVGEIWRRVSELRQAATRVARELGLPRWVVVKMVLIFRALGGPPSQERMCVCTLLHPDLTDEMIADLFGRNVRWVNSVRLRTDEIRSREPFAPHLEYLDEGFRHGDPTPAEIAAEVRNIRSHWIDGVQGNYKDGINPFGRCSREMEVAR